MFSKIKICKNKDCQNVITKLGYDRCHKCVVGGIYPTKKKNKSKRKG